MTSIRKRTIRRPSSVSSRTMSAREGGWASWLSVLENIGSMIGTCIRGCQGAGDVRGAEGAEIVWLGRRLCMVVRGCAACP